MLSLSGLLVPLQTALALIYKKTRGNENRFFPTFVASFYHDTSYANRRIVLTKQRQKKKKKMNEIVRASITQTDVAVLKFQKISRSVVSPCNAANCSYNEIPVREERVNEQGRDVHGQLP